MAEIRVERKDGDIFRVDVREGSGHTVHDVTATDDHLSCYGGSDDPERLVQASFEFLLEREPKESILRSFELPMIERYFPEYREEMRTRI